MSASGTAEQTHRAALSGQAGVEGVRNLLYGRATRHLLRRRLMQMVEPGTALGPCRLERAKLKPGRKLTGYYLVEARGPAGAAGGAPRRIEVVWLSGGSAPSEATHAAEARMEREAVAAGVVAPFATLGLDVPAEGFSIRVSPLDAAFPHLVRLSQPAHAAALLAGTPGSCAGGGPSGGWAVTALRFRPRQRHVLRYDPVAGGQRAGSPVFVKLYRDLPAAERAVRVANALADSLDGADPDLTAVRPLTSQTRECAVLYPEVSGRPLAGQLFTRSAGRHLTRAGALLRTLHAGVHPAPADLGRHTLEGELDGLRRAAEVLDPLLPATAREVDRIVAQAAGLARVIPAGEPRTAHGDYKADHVWADGSRLTLLDFDTCCLAEPALDVGKFLADLSWWYAAHRRPGLAAAQQSFLDGYRTLDADGLARARLLEAVVLTKLTIRRFRRFEPDWAAQTSALIGHAGRLVDALMAGQTSIPRSSAS